MVSTTLVDHRSGMLERLRTTPQQLRVAVSGLSDAQLDTPYGPGKWTIRQVVHHLADSHMNAFVRMKLVLTEDKPTLKTYDQDDWADTVDGKSLPIASSLSIIDGLHERMCRMLESVPDSAWSRSAVHPERGDITLDDLLAIYARHGEKHIATITGLRAEKGW